MKSLEEEMKKQTDFYNNIIDSKQLIDTFLLRNNNITSCRQSQDVLFGSLQCWSMDRFSNHLLAPFISIDLWLR